MIGKFLEEAFPRHAQVQVYGAFFATRVERARFQTKPGNVPMNPFRKLPSKVAKLLEDATHFTEGAHSRRKRSLGFEWFVSERSTC